MLDVLMQILVLTVVAGFPLAAIFANFMQHRLNDADEGKTLRSDSAIEDGMIPLLLTFSGSTVEESKRAA